MFDVPSRLEWLENSANGREWLQQFPQYVKSLRRSMVTTTLVLPTKNPTFRLFFLSPPWMDRPQC
jgi:hypothetical protein